MFLIGDAPFFVYRHRLSGPEFASFRLSRDDVVLRNEIGKGSFGVVYEAEVKGLR